MQVVADFTNSTQVAELIDTTLAHYGKLDVLVLNAGLFVETDFINNASNVIHDTDLSFQIGVRAHLQIILKAVNALSKAKGSIVAISSDWVQSPVITSISCCQRSCLTVFTYFSKKVSCHLK